MLKKQYLCCLLAALGLFNASIVSAATVEFLPSSDTVAPNELFDVDVFVTGLGPDQIVSTFDINVSYNASVVSLTDITYGSLLGDPLNPAETLIIEVPAPGDIGIQETSFLDEIDLLFMQDDGDPIANSVFLVSLTFLATEVGSADLGYVLNDIFGALFILPPTTLADIANPVGAVDVTVVPLPGAAWLMLTGLLGIGAAARKRARPE